MDARTFKIYFESFVKNESTCLKNGSARKHIDISGNI